MKGQVQNGVGILFFKLQFQLTAFESVVQISSGALYSSIFLLGIGHQLIE